MPSFSRKSARETATSLFTAAALTTGGSLGPDNPGTQQHKALSNPRSADKIALPDLACLDPDQGGQNGFWLTFDRLKRGSNIVKKVITWIVVADHQRFHVFQNDGPGHGLHALPSYDRIIHLEPSREIVSDGPGKGFSAADGRRHGMEAKSDPHRASAAAFIDEAVETLTEASDRGEFERLIVIAPPRALGEFRAALPAKLQRKLVGELAQDLSKATVKIVSEHVYNLLAV